MYRGKQLREAKNVIREIDKLSSNLFIIHYSCSSFKIDSVNSTRIVSICVKNFYSGIVNTFSIINSSEILNKEILNDYNLIEKTLLEDFFSFLKDNKNSFYIHWNMRDDTFGFRALEHRLKVLGGAPFYIDDYRKFDLSDILCKRYSVKYIGHPRLESLMNLNKITDVDFLHGECELTELENSNFKKLINSNQRKVEVLSAILSKTIDGSLKVKASFFDVYGFTFVSVIKYIYECWVYKLFSIVSILYTIVTLFKKFWR